ncbi:hypothetical protein JTE90_005462 [Oedothorax gibbosus]|uniref:Fatty acid desaturase domain-containing protein n=1 Tax=Oedothorax gibbosus TaxID=931172 RepID=A0AAV6U596_9ARAC|nr:hypothetical protein JTE90_005462 [Oedothorax gibbosus]
MTPVPQLVESNEPEKENEKQHFRKELSIRNEDINKNSDFSLVPEEKEDVETNIPEYKREIVYFNILLFILLHGTCFYGLYLGWTSASWKTNIFAILYGYVGGIGITAGAHRLWSHRAYKAKWPLRVFLCILASISSQGDLYRWCRDHRVHHKFAGTDADPHNIKRGFFFAHMGWVLCKKHPLVKAKGDVMDLEDLKQDPIVMFHKNYYIPQSLFFGFFIPVMIPWYMWGESLWNAFFIADMTRYCISLNIAWLVNSAAHMYGDHPYDTRVEATENSFVSFFAQGEGWHNYHHVYPWDYSTSELGYKLNTAKRFIDLMAKLGLAYDLKTVKQELVDKRKIASGDGTRQEQLLKKTE